MSYWENRYIDYLGEQDGQIGGDGWRDDFNPQQSLKNHFNGVNQMAPIWKPQENETYRAWIDSIIDEASDDLNDWENSFLDSLSSRLISGYNLTQAQAEKLEQLYTKHTK